MKNEEVILLGKEDEEGKVKRKRLFLYFSPVLFHFLSQLAHGYDHELKMMK